MKQIVFINGKPRTGKDSFVQLVQKNTKIATYNYSMVDSVRDIMKIFGIEETKIPNDHSQRNQMSDCKDFLQKFNVPYQHLFQTVKDISKKHLHFIVFVQAREPKDIEMLGRAFLSLGYSTTSVLMKRNLEGTDKTSGFSNHADANVENFEYHHVIDNNGSLRMLNNRAKEFMNKLHRIATLDSQQRRMPKYKR